MKKFNILILTDHLTHSNANSIYEMSAALRAHPAVGRLHLASRGNEANRGFFYHFDTSELEVWSMREGISYEKGLKGLTEKTVRVDARYYDVVWLRLPRPIPSGFFSFLTHHINERRIINRPSGIVETSNKKFLLQIPELCPPIAFCDSMEVIHELHNAHPIVLKPVESYGGKGVIRVEQGKVYESTQQIPLEDYQPVLENQIKNHGGYLAMRYLKNVGQGDKRIVVVNGEIVGAALRLPPQGSWICNASQGGSSIFAEPDEQERWMIERLNEELLPRGIAMYGIDTLVGDDGRRTLSEVNTLSIGGVKQMAELSGLPLVKRSADLLVNYIREHIPFREKRIIPVIQ